MRKKTKKPNPFLMHVFNPGKKKHNRCNNPGYFSYNEDAHKKYLEMKRYMPTISQDEAKEALRQYWQQHGCLPCSMKVVNHHFGNQKALVAVGKAKEVFYSPPANSRKAPHDYKHDTSAILVTDASGDMVGYVGNMKMRNDGWLHG